MVEYCAMEKWLEMVRGAKGVVFDFGGVLAYPPGDGWGAYRVAQELGLSREAFDAGFRKYRHLWDGDFIDGVEMYRRIFADNGLAAAEADPVQRALDVCMVKTQQSLSHDPLLKGRPRGFRLPVREIRRYSGAGFIVPVAGAINLLPGTCSDPAFRRIDVDTATGRIRGLY